MKQTRKLITLVLLALALNAAGKTVEAKSLPVKQPGAQEQSINNAPKKELYTVTAISFSGLQSLSEQELTASIPLKVMDKITIPGTELSGALQYLWKLQLFSDITVEKNDLGQNNIALKFTVTELPALDQVTFTGNSKLNSEDLKKTAALVTGKKISPQELLTAANKIEKSYAAKGYLTAEAKFKLEESGKNQVKALFSITEGPKVSIEKITFHGNTAFSQKKLRGVFKETNQNSWWRKIFGTPKLDNEKFGEDKNLLVEFYRDNGYRDARIVSDAISYTEDKKGLFLDIYLEEGLKYHIRNITWTGNAKAFATTEILDRTFRIKQGDLYSPKLIQERLNFSQDNSDVSSLYLDRGYLSFKTNIEELIIKPDQVDLVITMNEGEQFQFNTILIKGNTKTKDHVIRRELYTIPGLSCMRTRMVKRCRTRGCR